MDPSATPWRMLEEPANATPNPAVADRAIAARARAVPRTALLAGGAAVLLVVGAFALAFGTGASGTVVVDGGAPLTSPSSSASGPSAAANGRILVVEIVGAVDRPGVFRLPAGSRVGDLVAAAGGYGTRVDARRAERELNLAAVLRDGDQIRVPARDDAAASTARPPAGGQAPGGGSAASGSASAPIDLARATAAELDALPGIGPITAAKIIASREEQPFTAVEDLRTRKLLGEKTFTQLKDRLKVP